MRGLLLDRVDIFVNLVADRGGLALGPMAGSLRVSCSSSLERWTSAPHPSWRHTTRPRSGCCAAWPR
jgi:hypothetical protein